MLTLITAPVFFFNNLLHIVLNIAWYLLEDKGFNGLDATK